MLRALVFLFSFGSALAFSDGIPASIYFSDTGKTIEGNIGVKKIRPNLIARVAQACAIPLGRPTQRLLEWSDGRSKTTLLDLTKLQKKKSQGAELLEKILNFKEPYWVIKEGITLQVSLKKLLLKLEKDKDGVLEVKEVAGLLELLKNETGKRTELLEGVFNLAITGHPYLSFE